MSQTEESSRSERASGSAGQQRGRASPIAWPPGSGGNAGEQLDADMHWSCHLMEVVRNCLCESLAPASPANPCVWIRSALSGGGGLGRIDYPLTHSFPLLSCLRVATGSPGGPGHRLTALPLSPRRRYDLHSLPALRGGGANPAVLLVVTLKGPSTLRLGPLYATSEPVQQSRTRVGVSGAGRGGPRPRRAHRAAQQRRPAAPRRLRSCPRPPTPPAGRPPAGQAEQGGRGRRAQHEAGRADHRGDRERAADSVGEPRSAINRDRVLTDCFWPGI